MKEKHVVLHCVSEKNVTQLNSTQVY